MLQYCGVQDVATCPGGWVGGGTVRALWKCIVWSIVTYHCGLQVVETLFYVGDVRAP